MLRIFHKSNRIAIDFVQPMGFTSVLLVFAWTQARDTPVILGHMNFFAEFNVSF
jgi:hypothetical protein